MSAPRADVVILGDIVVAAAGSGLRRAGAIAVADGRVLAVGAPEEVLATRGPRTRVIDAGSSAVVPGLHDFHIHLVALARARSEVPLGDGASGHEIAQRLRERAATLGPDAWVTGRGWSERQLMTGLGPIRDAVGERPAYLASHDGHSAWASPAALRLAGIGPSRSDPPGGRIERHANGEPTGVLRETALDLVDRLVPRLRGTELAPHLDATLAELAAFGITGATEAGDYTADGGAGPDAAMGDSYSALSGLADALDGRIRLTLGIPVDAIAAAAERGLRTGVPMSGRRTLRFGWAKEYADGALGSGTAAVFEPVTCGDGGTGILRVEAAELDRLLAASRRSGIALAVHAIGDRAAASVLDAIERGEPRRSGVPRERMEHLQLLRAHDRARLASLGITASIQPIHAAADRDLVEACWAGRLPDAYAFRSIADAGSLLAAGSDAPVESADPWLGVFAAIHRRLPDDGRGDWTPAESLSFAQALAAYTAGPANAIGAADEGHLRVGAVADLAVMDRSLAELVAGDERTASARSRLTMVGRTIVHEG